MLRRPGAVSLRVLVGLALSAAILSGCAAKEKASTSLPAPTTSAAPTTAALPPLGPPDFPVPAAARTKDAAGAEAFTRYWIDLLNRQRAIPAGKPLRDLGPKCSDCLRIAGNYDEAAAKKHYYQGGTLSIVSLAEPTVQADRAVVSFILRRDAVRIVDKAAAVVDPGLPLAPKESSGCLLIWSQSLHAWNLRDFTIG